MANYTAFIILIAIGIGLLDLFTDKWPAVQRQLFPIVVLLLYSLFAVLYYYGPDIWTYVPFYEQIGSPSDVWLHQEKYERFELGYSMYCSVLHFCGVSYWGMTATIKALYFLSLYSLLRRLPRRQLFSLACIVMVDCNLVAHETRQCLAVAFFIFMILLMQKNKYLLAAVCGVLVVSMHKSGFIPVGLTVLGVFFYNNRQYASIYTLLILLLMAMVMLPVQRISTSVLDALPLPESYIESLTHHLLLGRQFQIISIVYLSILLVISVYVSYSERLRYSWITYVVLAGMGIIVVLYPYFFLLSRIRSYFVPFIAFYLTVLMADEERTNTVPYSSMMKQLFMLLILVFFLHTAIGLERGARQLHTPIARACTVLELRHASSKQIRDRQMHTAYIYWSQEYMRNNNNKL